MKINKFLAIGVTVSMLLCGCGDKSASYDTTNADYEANYNSAQQETVLDYNYYCATDLVGEALADINAAGFEYDLIFSLAEYNVETAKPYTILIDGTYAFAAGVICKGNAVIIDGVKTSVSSMNNEPCKCQ